MRAWLVRFLSLYVFNIVVLLVIGLLTPAHVGFSVIWAAVVMSLAELFVKPFAQKRFAASTAKSARGRTKAGNAVVQTVVVLAIAAIIWVLTLLLSGVSAGGSWFWAWVLPPVIIAIGWLVYAKIDDRIEAHAGALYDKADAGIRGGSARPAGSSPSAASASSPAGSASSPAGSRGRAELDTDGLTPEQRKMLDDLK